MRMVHPGMATPGCGLAEPGGCRLAASQEVTMRYAWIALLLLFAGCAGYLPPAAGHPAPSTFD